MQVRDVSHNCLVDSHSDQLSAVDVSASQYSSHLDELPARVGGRENGWRRLSLKVLSRGGGTGTAGGGILREELSVATMIRKSEQPIR